MNLRFNATPVTCASCDFHGDFTAAVYHRHETGHAIVFRGVVQDLSQFTQDHIEANRQMMAREFWRRGF